MKNTTAPPKKRRVVLVGPAASGKTTLYHHFPDHERSVKYTTRPKRNGEVHGINYHFVDEYTFREMKTRGLFRFVEPPSVEDRVNMSVEDRVNTSTQREGWYGTTTMSWDTHRVFILSSTVVEKQLKRDRPIVVYLDIPDDVRRHRLRNRIYGARKIERIMDSDWFDFAGFRGYTYHITDPAFSPTEWIRRF
jgi:GTPase SAR1 family protein